MTELKDFNFKMPGKKRKTILYWKKVLKESGLDYTEVGKMTQEKKVWKSTVRERIRHLEEFDKSRGNKYDGERIERNVQVDASELKCNYCDKYFNSKAGLVTHRKRVHEVSSQKVTFKCEKCKMIFNQEGNFKNHAKACGGAESSDQNLRKCGKCLKEYAAPSFAAHRKRCLGADYYEYQEDIPRARVHRSEQAPCTICGTLQSKANMARHRRSCLNGREVQN